MLKDIEWKN